MEVELNQYLQPCDVSSFLSALPSSLSALNLSDSSYLISSTEKPKRNGFSTLHDKENNEVFSDPYQLPTRNYESKNRNCCKDRGAKLASQASMSMENIRPSSKRDTVINKDTADQTRNKDTVDHQTSSEQSSTQLATETDTQELLNSSDISHFETGNERQRKHGKASCIRQMSLPARTSAAAAQLKEGEFSGIRRRRSSVRFADELGQTLSTIVTIPSRFDDTIQRLTDSDSDTDNIRRTNRATQNANKYFTNSDFAVRNKFEATFHLSFNLPYKSYDSFLQKLQINSVCLESIKPYNTNNNIYNDSNKQHLKDTEECDRDTALCTVTVRNIGPQKQVVARCTYDDWKSFDDIVASYVEHRNGILVTEYDTFRFLITKPQAMSSSMESNCAQIQGVEFAIRYQVRDLTYWDNNDGKNYRLVWS